MLWLSHLRIRVHATPEGLQSSVSGRTSSAARTDTNDDAIAFELEQDGTDSLRVAEDVRKHPTMNVVSAELGARAKSANDPRRDRVRLGVAAVVGRVVGRRGPRYARTLSPSGFVVARCFRRPLACTGRGPAHASLIREAASATRTLCGSR